MAGQYGIKYGTDSHGSAAAVFKTAGKHALPTQLDLPEGQTKNEVAKWETMVGDRQMAVFFEERELSTTCEACKT